MYKGIKSVEISFCDASYEIVKARAPLLALLCEAVRGRMPMHRLRYLVRTDGKIKSCLKKGHVNPAIKDKPYAERVVTKLVLTPKDGASKKDVILAANQAFLLCSWFPSDRNAALVFSVRFGKEELSLDRYDPDRQECQISNYFASRNNNLG